MQSFDIENISTEMPQNIDINNLIPNIDENRPQESCLASNIKGHIRNGFGVGFSSVFANSILNCFDSKNSEKLSFKISKALLTHVPFQTMLRCDKNFKVPENFEAISTFTKNFVATNIGAICGVIAEECANIIANKNHFSEKNNKIIQDFMLLATFVAIEGITKQKISPHLSRIKCISYLERLPNEHILNIKNIDKKTLKFVADVISNTVGSLAIAYCMPNFENNDIDDLAKKGLIAGTLFCIAKTLTNNVLTGLYNNCIKKRQNGPARV